MRKLFFLFSAFLLLFYVVMGFVFPPVLWSLVVVGPVLTLGFYDAFQKQHAIRRNFPLIGNFRYLFEMIRPEINQYFVESDQDGRPFSREERSVIYQRAKDQMDTLPFGTRKDVYEAGYEWVNHSLAPVHCDPEKLRVTIGGSECKQPYSASLFNVSAMSFGALSSYAIKALSLGAKLGGFAHNTGEGGISKYHLEGGADLIWQIGTGYFGCRTPEGNFCDKTFAKNSQQHAVKMIEIKLSQGAKAGHGGILPAAKVTAEIAQARHVPEGKTVASPPTHSAFSNPVEMLEFVAKLRGLSDGKPVGLKLCIGKRREFLAICKAMLKTKIFPDFITVDGGEGGTGAAPLEFSNYVGCPLSEALIFVHNALVGIGVRGSVKVIAAGHIVDGFGIVKRLSLGADLCYSARAMMMALGCIQALRCNTNHCPTGIATQKPDLVRGLVVSEKSQRVREYHEATLHSAAEILGAMGLSHSSGLRPWHVMRRMNYTKTRHYGELYEFLDPNSLLDEKHLPASFERAWKAARAETFTHSGHD